MKNEVKHTAHALKRYDEPEKHPIYKLNKSESLAERLSGYFRQAFGVDLIVNRNEMQKAPSMKTERFRLGYSIIKLCKTDQTQTGYFRA